MVQKSNREAQQQRPNGALFALLFAPLLACLPANPAWCQAVPQVHIITPATPVLLAQVPSPGVLPTDSTKGNFLQDQASINPGFKLRLMQKLPARLWIQGQTEVNNRLDTNVFLTYKKPQPDYVFRIAPNLTVGYNVLENTSVYAQYFMIKDCYTVHHRPLTEPVTQSIAFGVRHYIIPYQSRYQTYLDCQARELFQSKGLRQADLNPSINTNIQINQHAGMFASALIQMRSNQLFLGPKREMDPFYTLGYYLRYGKYVFTFTDTFVTNYRQPHFEYSIPKHGNVNMIADFELARQLGNHPGMQLFVRAEPVFNWRSANAVGLSGFDFRLYGGLRVSFYKPSYLASMNQIKKQLQQQDGDDPNSLKAKGKGKNKGKGSGDGKDGKGDGKSPTTPATDPTAPTSNAPDAAPVPTPSASAISAPGIESIIAPSVGAIAAPVVGAIFSPTFYSTLGSMAAVIPEVRGASPAPASAPVPGPVPSTAPANAPGTASVPVPAIKAGTSNGGTVRSAVTDKTPPMAQKIEDRHQIDG